MVIGLVKLLISLERHGKMKYDLNQYKTLAERFNKMSFLQKIVTIKQQSDLFILEVDDCSNFFLRLNDDGAQLQGIDKWFEFPQEWSGKSFQALFSLIDINLKIV